MQGAEAYRAVAQRGIEVSRENGVEIIELTDEERARWAEAMQPATDAWLESAVGQGLSGTDVRALMTGE